MTLSDNDLELMFGGVFEREKVPEPGQNDRLISAEVIRALLLGLPFGDERFDSQQRQPIGRLIVRGALIATGGDGGEVLNLVDAGTAQGDQPPAIIFENCLFQCPIDLSHARLGRLSLKGSRLVSLKAHGASFAGNVDFSEIATSEAIVPDPAFPGRKPKCEIDMGGAHIAGHLRAKDAALTVRYRAPGERRGPNEPVPYALNLADCQIDGEVHIDRATIDGGLSLARAKVRGGLWMTGGTVLAEWDDASLVLEQAHLGGSVVLRAASDRNPMIPFRSVGCISMYATTIDGEVYCSGATLELRQASADWPKPETRCINAYQATIAKQLRFQEAIDDRPHISDAERAATMWFDYAGTILLQNCSAGGLTIRGTPLGAEKANNVPPPQRGIDISQSSFTGDVTIDAAHSQFKDAADRRHMTGALDAGWSKFERDFAVSNVACSRLQLYDSRNNGELLAENARFTERIGAGRSSVNRVRIAHAEANHLEMTSARVTNDCDVRDLTCEAIVGSPMHVGGKLLLAGIKKLKTLDLSESEIDKDLTILAIDQISHSGRFALTGAKVGANCELRQVASRTSLKCNRLRIAGDLSISNVKIVASTWDWMQLSLANANVVGSLQLSGIGFAPFISNQARGVGLPFYPSWSLVEVHQDGMGDTALLVKRSSTYERLKTKRPGSEGDSSGDVVLLDCTSPPIHRMNAEHLKLTDANVQDYLKFFCAYVWGEHGAFRLITDPAELDGLSAAGSDRETRPDLAERLTLKIVERTPEYYTINAIVSYSDALFASDFKIHASGLVEMLDDEPLALNISRDRLFSYDAPYRSAPRNSEFSADFVKFSSVWERYDEAELSQRYRKDDVFALDLSAARVGALHDDLGRALGPHVNLNLPVFNFEILDIDRPGTAASHGEAAKDGKIEDQFKAVSGKALAADLSHVDLRLKWLDRNKIGDEAVSRYVKAGSTNQFDAYPYERVADCYRKSGRSDDALAILRAKSSIVSDHWQRDWRRKWREFLFGGRSTFTQMLGVLTAFAALVAYSFPSQQRAGADDAVFALDAFGSPSTMAAAGSTVALLVIFGIALYWGPWILRKLFGICFGYGLGMGRALATVVACILAGWVAVEAANRGALRTPEVPLLGIPEAKLWDFAAMPQALVLSQTPVLTMVRTSENGIEPRAVAASADAPGDEIACGNQINGFIYALDVFLPLVDLQQEAQCQPTQQAWGVGWRWGKAAYALLGWVVISLSIVMMTGFLRRQSVE